MECDRKPNDGSKGSWLTHENGVRAEPLSTIDGGGVWCGLNGACGRRFLLAAPAFVGCPAIGSTAVV